MRFENTNNVVFTITTKVSRTMQERLLGLCWLEVIENYVWFFNWLRVVIHYLRASGACINSPSEQKTFFFWKMFYSKNLSDSEARAIFANNNVGNKKVWLYNTILQCTVQETVLGLCWLNVIVNYVFIVLIDCAL